MPKALSVFAVDDFVARKTFHCAKINVRLTPAACVERQNRLTKIVGQGVKWKCYDTPRDNYCREGDATGPCVQGARIKLKEKRHAQTKVSRTKSV